MPMPADLALPGRLGLPPQWQRPMIGLLVGEAALAFLFREDWAAMAGQWWNSSTYNHVLLVPPILLWLAWQSRAVLRRLAPAPWWPGGGVFAVALALWLLGALSGVALARHAGTVGMAATVVPLLFGPVVGRALAFPLGYVIFLVPFGEELVPSLQMLTAGLVIALTRLSGISAAIDGVFIATPAGLFEVAEACSGARFLVAMLAFGVLAAHVGFVSWRRRLGFILLCLVASIVANGIRAWGTIALAQVLGAKAAGGVDHVVYGWVFFAFAITLVLLCGGRYFDRPAAETLARLPAADIRRSWKKVAAAPGGSVGVGPVGMLLAMACAGQGWAQAAERLSAPLPRQIDLPEVPGWRRVDYAPQLWWEPRAAGAAHRLLGRYADGSGRSVDVFVALWASQQEGREAGGFGQGALVPDSGWAWQGQGAPVPDGHAQRLLGRGMVARSAETYYRTGTLLTGSNLRLRLAVLADRLVLRPRPTMMLILSAEHRPEQDYREATRQFRHAVGPLEAWMDRIGSGG